MKCKWTMTIFSHFLISDYHVYEEINCMFDFEHVW